jgi:hypothetical protein
MLRRTLALAFTLLATASCAGDSATGLTAADSSASLRLPLLGGSSTPQLLQCTPPASAQSVSALIGPLGGTLAIGGTRIVIPENAVLTPTTFTLTIPQSALAEVSIRAGDAEHYLFQLPVLVTIDYSRCTSGLSLLRPVTAWHIDETSKALLEQMPGVDLRLLASITFSTPHLSGYAVAD